MTPKLAPRTKIRNQIKLMGLKIRVLMIKMLMKQRIQMRLSQMKPAYLATQLILTFCWII